ncbi:MAG: GDSL-type esterase/lipase family protein [Eubacteriales bacterium]|jgi:acyl-CoA thioesterase-1
MKTYVFYGDSVTDCDHNYDLEELGDGYVRSVAGYLGFGYGEVRVQNLGQDGLTSSGLRARLAGQAAPNADVYTVLIGINDLYVDGGISPEQYRRNLDEIVRSIRSGHPDSELVLMEPFVFDSYPASSDWKDTLDMMTHVLSEEAREEHVHFLPLREKLTREAEILGEAAVTEDGIHPTRDGHEVIAKTLLKLLQTF